MKTSRVATAVTVAAAAALVLAGCGRGATEESATVSTCSGAAPKGTIEVWAMGAEGELLPKLAEEFEAKYPDVTVKVTPVPWDAAQQKITTAIASGETPDMLQVGTTWLPGFVGQDGFLPVPNGLVDPETFFPGAWDTGVVGGTAYGVPWYYGSVSLFYRTDLAGAMKAPTSWDELVAFTEGMQKAGAKYGITLPTAGRSLTLSWASFYFQAGGKMLDASGKFQLDSQATRDALDFYASFVEKGIAPPTFDPDTRQQGFINGSLGALVDGSYYITNLNTVAGADFDSDYAVVPLPAGKTRGAFAGGSDLSVFKSAKNPDGAWAFIKWLSEPETQLRWYEISSDGPAVRSAWEQPPLSTDPKMHAFGDTLEYATATPAIPTWVEIESKLDALIEARIAGRISSDEAAKQMQAAAESIGTGLK